MSPRTVLHLLMARERLLTVTAVAMTVALIAIAVVAPFDSRIITGINPWIKPAKFLISIALFLATMAWFMPDIDAPPRTKTRLARIFAGTMIIEIACIALQAARGTTSHFNYATVFDAAIFQVMGTAITVNTVAVAVLLWHLRRDVPPERAGYLLGVRLGLALFVLGSLEGFAIVANMGHAVPGPDGGPGWPLVNWATDRGDLRITHFVALHAAQGLPLWGYLLDRRAPRAAAPRRVAVAVVAAAWAAVVALAFVLALRGQPLLRP